MTRAFVRDVGRYAGPAIAVYGLMLVTGRMVLVPFVFVFSPALLIVAKGFTPYDFTVTFAGCVLGIVALSAALSRYLLTEMRAWERLLAVFAALLLIAPGLRPTVIGLALLTPVLLSQIRGWRGARRARPV